ncbi:MAG: hypothetical protein B6I24_03625 [Bacteroidetes bacterium 4572_128]|nr:MAG: hypothetical protein B6I24_03625 [Bacteroidetes bacterium 4572_128]
MVKIISKKAIKIKYKYHYMANDNTMIFRYDNVKHHHNISTFPHHKHIPSKIVPSEEPDLVIILSEINNMLINF